MLRVASLSNVQPFAVAPSVPTWNCPERTSMVYIGNGYLLYVAVVHSSTSLEYSACIVTPSFATNEPAAVSAISFVLVSTVRFVPTTRSSGSMILLMNYFQGFE